LDNLDKFLINGDPSDDFDNCNELSDLFLL